MKTVWSILIISIFALFTFHGIGLITTQAVSNGNLDNESINTISLYDGRLKDFKGNFTSVKNISTEEPDVSDYGDFFKEYADLKTRFDQIKDGVLLMYKIPDIIVLSVPFINIDDVSFFRNLIWFIIGVGIILAIYQGLKTGRVSDD